MWHCYCVVLLNCYLKDERRGVQPYLIFVIFFTRAKFLESKIYTEKRLNYGKIHSKLPIFCVITAKYTVNCQIVALNRKNLPQPKKITRIYSWGS